MFICVLRLVPRRADSRWGTGLVPRQLHGGGCVAACSSAELKAAVSAADIYSKLLGISEEDEVNTDFWGEYAYYNM